MATILYVCNQKKECNKSILCGHECTHTADINYAKNFSHETIVMGDQAVHVFEERKEASGED